jgi:hypothetical protein
MKKLAIVLAVASLLNACGSTKDTFTNRVVDEQSRQDRFAEASINKAPEWMFKLPKSANAIYENGTAISSDFGMADLKAKTIAYAKICTAAGGKVRSQTKIFRSDSDAASTESSELAVRSICPDVDISGVETVEMKHISEGGRIRTYALVALPTGAANSIRKENDARSTRDAANRRAPEAFNEVDGLVTGKKPQTEGASVKTSEGDFQLLPVENEEARKRRAEALKKPGAVVGQTTIR